MVIDMYTRLIFIADKFGEDIGIFGSIEDAAAHLEAVDVRNEEYVGFDSDGKLLKIEADNNRVFIYPSEDVATHIKDLKERLITYLEAVGEELDENVKLSLPCLVEISSKYKYACQKPSHIIKISFCQLFRKLLYMLRINDDG